MPPLRHGLRSAPLHDTVSFLEDTVRAPQMSILVFLAACSSSGTVTFNEGKVSEPGANTVDGAGEGEGEAGTTEPEEVGDWSGSTLVVDTPLPGDTLPYGEASAFAAVVLDASGSATDFTELVWTTDGSDWTEVGDDFESDGLDVGNQTLFVEAVLPDGTLLRNGIGGIRVQHPDAGTYVGNLAVDISGEYNGFPITASCIGAAIVGVDVYGERASGDSTCIVSLLGYSVDALHVFDFGVNGEDVEGTVSLDLSFFQLDFTVTGNLNDHTIVAEWATDYGGFIDVSGAMELDRVTTEVVGGE